MYPIENKTLESIIKGMTNRRICYSYLLAPISLIILIFHYLFFMKHQKYPSQYSNYMNHFIDCFKTNCLFFCGCEGELLDNGRSYYNISIAIENCFFSRLLQYSSDGGVIYIFGGSHTMNITITMFYNCTCSSDGGAILFYSLNLFLNMVCANRCSASNFHFSYLRASQTNSVEFLSVSQCSHLTTGYYPICIYNGYQTVYNTNSSMNHAIQTSGIYIILPTSFTGSFCTISSNKVSHSISIYLNSNSGIVSSTNIVNNNSPSGNAVIYSYGSYILSFCVMDNNENTLFRIQSGSLEISNSIISHAGALSTSTSVSTSMNNTIDLVEPYDKRNTYQIQFYNSYYCNADIPFILPTLIYTMRISPLKTPEETISMTEQETYIMTYETTIKETNNLTPELTIHRSYMDCKYTNPNRREIIVIFALSFSYVYPLIILFLT